MKLENTTSQIDHASSTPLHLQAESFVRQLINEERYQKGELLPNEVNLAQLLGISRNTLRQAINKLVFEGILERKKGVGTKVIKNNVFSSAKNWMSFSQEMNALGIEVQNFELFVGKRKVESDVSDFFETDKNSKLFTLERLRGKQDFPFVYFISHFNPKIDLSDKDDFNKPLYDIINTKGYNATTSVEMISAMLCDETLAAKFEINCGEPILKRKRLVYDDNKFPIEYNIGYYRADSFTYSIECTKK